VLNVELPRENHAPGIARSLITERFANELSNDELDTAKLLVSELVSNAVRHGRGRITLRAGLNTDRLRVEVLDDGLDLERAVQTRDFDNRSSGGRGLMVVDAWSSRWGVHRGTTHVWFELERPGPRARRVRGG